MDGITGLYAQDSFFTLTLPGQIGLGVLSTVLAIGLVTMTWQITCRRKLMLRLLAALALFWLFVWLSPQVYYGYYMLLFDGLPVQRVIRTPPSLFDLAKLLGFVGGNDLSGHGLGVLGWVILLTALRPQRYASAI